MKVARAFYGISLGLAIVLFVWATISSIFSVNGGWLYPIGFFLWLVTGLPLLVAAIVIHAFRRGRTSMRMPSHHPDWARDQLRR